MAISTNDFFSGCSLVNLKVEKGLTDVIGARYKLVISFDEEAGLLPPYMADEDIVS